MAELDLGNMGVRASMSVVSLVMTQTSSDANCYHSPSWLLVLFGDWSLVTRTGMSACECRSQSERLVFVHQFMQHT